MTRTNIDIDDDLVAEIMSAYNVRTKREAVDLALRLARRPRPLKPDEIRALRGTIVMDPDYDLDAVRRMRLPADDSDR